MALSSRVIPVTPLAPRRGNAFSQWFGRMVLWIMGWRVTGELPNVRKAVLIAAPHTSNIDGVLTVASMLALGVKFSFLVKHTAFSWPFGGFMRWIGAVPVNRDNATDIVRASANQFEGAEELWIALAPEGTRHSAKNWKTGFYWMAKHANVPILPVAFDYRTREIRVLKTHTASGDAEQDIAAIIAAYKGIVPRHPERLSIPLQELKK